MWQPARTVEGRILAARRLNNSVNGNPRFVVTVNLTDGTVESFMTSSDSASAYDVENVQRSGEQVLIGLTRAGRVATISRLGDVEATSSECHSHEQPACSLCNGANA